MPPLEFNEQMAAELETVYGRRDIRRRRALVHEALGACGRFLKPPAKALHLRAQRRLEFAVRRGAIVIREQRRTPAGFQRFP